MRTLWRGEIRPAGAVVVDWNGMDDDGRPVSSAGPFTARILSHNVTYVWEGVIGNTSRDITGPSVHRAYNPINDMALDAAGNAFYVVGYNEQQNAIHRFRTEDPQVKHALLRDDYRRVFQYVATDGNLVYLANMGLLAAKGAFNREPSTFVAALRVADGKEHVFAGGRTVYHVDPNANRWVSVIDYDRDDRDDGERFVAAPAGIAVQKKGRTLFVSHPGTNEIRLFDKIAGSPLGRIEIDGATDLDVAPDDTLRVLRKSNGKSTVAAYRPAGSGWVKGTEIAQGLVDPVAIGVSPLDGALLVVDAGTQQVKAFDGAGRPIWTLGRSGGYASGAPGVDTESGSPAVDTDRFWFSAGPTYLAFQADGSFWVGDPGNARNLHFSAQRKYLEQIMYLPGSYVSSVDATDPTRVFNQFLEFHVDYDKPLAESWTLVRNWGGAVPQRYFGFGQGIRMVTTLPNGRTYAVLSRFQPATKEVVELTAAGIRPTGVTLDLGVRLYPDGSLRGQRMRSRSFSIFERKLTGFDGDGNPEWSRPSDIAEARASEGIDPYYHDVPVVWAVNEAVFPETDRGVIVSFNPGTGAGFHLGGIVRGDRQWLWRGSPTGEWELDSKRMVARGDGSYEVGRGVQYAGNVVMTAGQDIVFGYHGEAWNQGQANQWIHYQDDGMFVGQFGVPTYPHNNHVEAWAGSAGNAFSATLVEVGGKVYLWHNDEGVHGGVHRWRIDGLDGVTRLSAPIEP